MSSRLEGHFVILEGGNGVSAVLTVESVGSWGERSEMGDGQRDFDRAKMAMHSGDGSWFVSDPLQRLLHPLLHRKPSKLALQDIK
ncbi:hypothetical protein NC651_026409 [Populus alba x Populus x berolinensis]|nr:hypothetical protein NC651_026409 [Populus alba x Populus x berolinensis]